MSTVGGLLQCCAGNFRDKEAASAYEILRRLEAGLRSSLLSNRDAKKRKVHETNKVDFDAGWSDWQLLDQISDLVHLRWVELADSGAPHAESEVKALVSASESLIFIIGHLLSRRAEEASDSSALGLSVEPLILQRPSTHSILHKVAGHASGEDDVGLSIAYVAATLLERRSTSESDGCPLLTTITAKDQEEIRPLLHALRPQDSFWPRLCEKWTSRKRLDKSQERTEAIDCLEDPVRLVVMTALLCARFAVSLSSDTPHLKCRSLVSAALASLMSIKKKSGSPHAEKYVTAFALTTDAVIEQHPAETKWISGELLTYGNAMAVAKCVGNDSSEAFFSALFSDSPREGVLRLMTSGHCNAFLIDLFRKMESLVGFTSGLANFFSSLLSATPGLYQDWLATESAWHLDWVNLSHTLNFLKCLCLPLRDTRQFLWKRHRADTRDSVMPSFPGMMLPGGEIVPPAAPAKEAHVEEEEETTGSDSAGVTLSSTPIRAHLKAALSTELSAEKLLTWLIVYATLLKRQEVLAVQRQVKDYASLLITENWMTRDLCQKLQTKVQNHCLRLLAQDEKDEDANEIDDLEVGIKGGVDVSRKLEALDISWEQRLRLIHNFQTGYQAETPLFNAEGSEAPALMLLDLYKRVLEGISRFGCTVGRQRYAFNLNTASESGFLRQAFEHCSRLAEDEERKAEAQKCTELLIGTIETVTAPPLSQENDFVTIPEGLKAISQLQYLRAVAESLSAALVPTLARAVEHLISSLHVGAASLSQCLAEWLLRPSRHEACDIKLRTSLLTDILTNCLRERDLYQDPSPLSTCILYHFLEPDEKIPRRALHLTSTLSGTVTLPKDDASREALSLQLAADLLPFTLTPQNRQILQTRKLRLILSKSDEETTALKSLRKSLKEVSPLPELTVVPEVKAADAETSEVPVPRAVDGGECRSLASQLNSQLKKKDKWTYAEQMELAEKLRELKAEDSVETLAARLSRVFSQLMKAGQLIAPALVAAAWELSVSCLGDRHSAREKLLRTVMKQTMLKSADGSYCFSHEALDVLLPPSRCRRWLLRDQVEAENRSLAVAAIIIFLQALWAATPTAEDSTYAQPPDVVYDALRSHGNCQDPDLEESAEQWENRRQVLQSLSARGHLSLLIDALSSAEDPALRTTALEGICIFSQLLELEICRCKAAHLSKQEERRRRLDKVAGDAAKLKKLEARFGILKRRYPYKTALRDWAWLSLLRRNAPMALAHDAKAECTEASEWYCPLFYAVVSRTIALGLQFPDLPVEKLVMSQSLLLFKTRALGDTFKQVCWDLLCDGSSRLGAEFINAVSSMHNGLFSVGLSQVVGAQKDQVATMSTPALAMKELYESLRAFDGCLNEWKVKKACHAQPIPSA